ncbi:pseudouridine synthase [Parasediminibacterium sp. JCM 36343]|uniref:pseudouridine synthase n=1 Tax=Parasediminibacterium sp. JCM 36343 TaxID=3374279 RepID=UPI00397E50CA
MHHYYIIYKPYMVLCQFSPQDGKQTLADFFNVPKDVYPVGRLDYDSEGLLILTNDKQLNNRLLNPLFAHEREYWVQVDGNATHEAVEILQKGVAINVDGKTYYTKPCTVSLFTEPPLVPERNPPIRFRKEIPAPWLKLILKEGKNRQVRKMTAAVGFPTLRLIRYRIEKLTIDGIKPGEIKEMDRVTLFEHLFSNSKFNI